MLSGGVIFLLSKSRNGLLYSLLQWSGEVVRYRSIIGAPFLLQNIVNGKNLLKIFLFRKILNMQNSNKLQICELVILSIVFRKLIFVLRVMISMFYQIRDYLFG